LVKGKNEKPGIFLVFERMHVAVNFLT